MNTSLMYVFNYITHRSVPAGRASVRNLGGTGRTQNHVATRHHCLVTFLFHAYNAQASAPTLQKYYIHEFVGANMCAL